MEWRLRLFPEKLHFGSKFDEILGCTAYLEVGLYSAISVQVCLRLND